MGILLSESQPIQWIRSRYILKSELKNENYFYLIIIIVLR